MRKSAGDCLETISICGNGREAVSTVCSFLRLYKASEAVAMLDMLASFASQALQAGEESGCRMVRPIVGGEGVLAIKLGNVLM
eukprot:SAG31_NODE_1445_length_8320_cov_3.454081_8_plen_83_part_00